MTKVHPPSICQELLLTRCQPWNSFSQTDTRGQWKMVSEGPQAWVGLVRAAGFKEKCTETRKTTEVLAFRMCLGIKVQPGFWESSWQPENLALLFLSNKDHFWYLTLDTLTGTGWMGEKRICFCSFKKEEKGKAFWFLKSSETLPEKYLISAFLSFPQWCRKWCPPHVKMYFWAGVFLKMFQACRLLILFPITKMIASQWELWLV